jgi:hypothetical protein
LFGRGIFKSYDSFSRFKPKKQAKNAILQVFPLAKVSMIATSQTHEERHRSYIFDFCKYFLGKKDFF